MTAQTLIMASLSVSTQKTYARSFLRYSQFSHHAFPGVPVWPVNVCTLVAYIASLFRDNKAPTTIASALSPLAFVHKVAGIPDPTECFIVKKMLSGASKLRKQPDARLPIVPHVLKQLVVMAKFASQSEYERRMLTAMFTTAFYAFLRIGEITVRSSCISTSRVIQFEDITFLRDASYVAKAVEVKIVHFKHNKSQRPVTLVLQAAKSDPCPVKCLLQFCHLRGDSPGPLFKFRDGSAVSRAFFSSRLADCVKLAGLDSNLFKGHSFRIGAATTAFAKGVSDEQIKMMGRWKSSAYKRYIRVQTLKL